MYHRSLGGAASSQAVSARMNSAAIGTTQDGAGAPPGLSHGMPRASFETRDEELLRRSMGARAPGAAAATVSAYPHHGCPAASGQASGRLAPVQEEYDQWRARHPCILARLQEVQAGLRGKRLAVFLDYDGTLTPIVSNPDEAVLSHQMREVIRNLARLYPTAIISGRGREKVQNFVQLKELYYAGSHGMDIAGPQATGSSISNAGLDIAFQPAAHFRPQVDKVYQELCRRLSTIPGATVEHNTFCVSAHFRNCDADNWHLVVAAVEQVVAENPELRITKGRKVVEVRPKVNWHKGTALNHLLGVLGLRGASDVVALYIGDDHTDEDAFRVLKESHQGFGILVSTKPRETAAAYTVRDPSEVQAFLQALVAWGETDCNGWRNVQQIRPAPAAAHGTWLPARTQAAQSAGSNQASQASSTSSGQGPGHCVAAPAGQHAGVSQLRRGPPLHHATVPHIPPGPHAGSGMLPWPRGLAAGSVLQATAGGTGSWSTSVSATTVNS